MTRLVERCIRIIDYAISFVLLCKNLGLNKIIGCGKMNIGTNKITQICITVGIIFIFLGIYQVLFALIFTPSTIRYLSNNTNDFYTHIFIMQLFSRLHEIITAAICFIIGSMFITYSHKTVFFIQTNIILCRIITALLLTRYFALPIFQLILRKIYVPSWIVPFEYISFIYLFIFSALIILIMLLINFHYIKSIESKTIHEEELVVM